jgi:hypothetical protein
MYDEPDLGDWADLDVSRAAEDEDAARRFVAGPGRGLDIRTVRSFLAECRRRVGPEPILEPALDMVMDGIRYEWGLWFRPRHGGGRHDGWSEQIDAVPAVEYTFDAEVAPSTVDSLEAGDAVTEDAVADVAEPPPLPAQSAMSARPSSARSAARASAGGEAAAEDPAGRDSDAGATLPAAGRLSSVR